MAVAARWDAGDTLPPTVTSLPAFPRSEPDLPVQLSPVGSAPRPASVPQAANGAREIVFPPRDGGEAPAWSSGGFPATPAPAQERPSAPSRTAPLTLARSAVAAAGAAPGAGPREHAGGRPGRRGPRLARHAAGRPDAAGRRRHPGRDVHGDPHPPARGGAAPTSAPQPSNGRSDRELDELAKALFGRIRTQLKSEVIHEREAKGLGFDAF